MSKTLKFKDNTEIQFTDNSTIYDCITVLNDFADIDEIKVKFTEENLAGALFDGERVENIVPQGISIDFNYQDNITVHFINRDKTHDEITDEQIEEIQVALTEIVG